eukprot:11179690-Lingulodinium_polyedra.AAC.1
MVTQRLPCLGSLGTGREDDADEEGTRAEESEEENQRRTMNCRRAYPRKLAQAFLASEDCGPVAMDD